MEMTLLERPKMMRFILLDQKVTITPQGVFTMIVMTIAAIIVKRCGMWRSCTSKTKQSGVI